MNGTKLRFRLKRRNRGGKQDGMGDLMKLGEAIQTAIDYETKVLNVYQKASDTVSNTVGKRLFQALADDEQYHVEYLKKKLDQWQATGQLTVKDLKSSNPDIEVIASDIGMLESRMSEEGQQLFSRFILIEDGHIAAVQAELDFINSSGYWFDSKEFDME